MMERRLGCKSGTGGPPATGKLDNPGGLADVLADVFPNGGVCMLEIVKTEVVSAAGPEDERYQTDGKIAFRMENAPLWLAEQMFGESAPPPLPVLLNKSEA
jgi:hypothetical protein